MSALIDILQKGGCYWPRPPKGPGRALAVPNGARFRIAVDPPTIDAPRDERPSGGTKPTAPGGRKRKDAKPSRARDTPEEPAAEPPAPIFVGGVCRNGAFVIDEGAHAGRRFDTADAAAAAVGAPAEDLFARVAFLVGERWMSADALRRSDALPWDEVDEMALTIAAEAIRDKLRDEGETLGEAAVIRKAADAVATFPHFLAEAKERLEWMR